MEKSVEISLRLAEESMKRSKKLEKRITELENLNIELQSKIDRSENQAKEKAKEAEIATEALKKLVKPVFNLDREIKVLKEDLEVVEFYMTKAMEPILEKLVNDMNDQHQAEIEELQNARKEELDAKEREIKKLEQEREAEKEETKAKDRKIIEVEQQLQAVKDKTEVATDAIANTLKLQKKDEENEKEHHHYFCSKSVAESGDDMGLKYRGVIDCTPFVVEVRRRSLNGVGYHEAIESYLYWEKLVQDKNWKPFKTIMKNGKNVEIIDESNNDLYRLKMSSDVEVYEAVKKALVDIKEHNRKGRYPVLEFWNYSKNRKATLDEGLKYLADKSNKEMHISD